MDVWSDFDTAPPSRGRREGSRRRSAEVRGGDRGPVRVRLGPRRVAGCGKLYRARSRLYRNEILQVNTRWKALAEIYTMQSFALLCRASSLRFACLFVDALFLARVVL